MYRFVKANEESNTKYMITNKANRFIGVISDQVEDDGLCLIYTLSKHGIVTGDMSYAVEEECFDDYEPSEDEIQEWINYAKEWGYKETYEAIEKALSQKYEKQLLPEINIDDMF